MYGIAFDSRSGLSQYQQLVDQLRRLIVQGTLAGGERLASTREMAQSLRLARGIVLEAVDQLKMEGYLEARRGSGCYVRPALAWTGGGAPPSIGVGRGGAAARAPAGDSKLSFAPGMPDLALFPKRKWIQCYAKAVEYATGEDLAYAAPQGRADLRLAIAEHLARSRGMRISPEDVVVCAGSSQGMALLAAAVPAARVLMEDPQAPFIRRIFQGLGCALSYRAVDEQGMLPPEEPGAYDFIYLTPAHQFPVGGTLGAERRARILDYARAAGAWVVEDDFDAEFRYGQRPVAPMQVLAPDRVVFVGSFSKYLSPALRIGYLVLPRGLKAKVKTAKRRWDLWNESVQQKALAIFMAEGHFYRHIRRTQAAYRAKNQALLALAARLLPNWDIIGANTGMHVALRPPPAGQPGAAKDLSARLAARGFAVETLHSYCQTEPRFRDGLIVSYGNRDLDELEKLLAALAEIASQMA